MLSQMDRKMDLRDQAIKRSGLMIPGDYHIYLLVLVLVLVLLPHFRISVKTALMVGVTGLRPSQRHQCCLRRGGSRP